MIKFIPILADKHKGKFENNKYLPFVLNLFCKYKDTLIDDYYPKDNMDLLSSLIDEINKKYPWFLVCLDDNNPIGVIWISHLYGRFERYHSCQLHFCIDRKYQAGLSKNAMDEILGLLFEGLGVERVQIEIPCNDHNTCSFIKKMGFVREGIIRCATIRNGEPVNNIIFSKLKGEYTNGE